MAVRREPHLNLDPDKVSRQLKLSGHSARSFAKSAGISVGTLSGILQHGRSCSPATARKIAAAFEKSPPITGIVALLED